MAAEEVGRVEGAVGHGSGVQVVEEWADAILEIAEQCATKNLRGTLAQQVHPAKMFVRKYFGLEVEDSMPRQYDHFQTTQVRI